MFVILFGIMYFLMVRPAKKQQQSYQKMINSLAVGDEVILRSGLHGKISELNANTITIDAEDIFLVFERGAVMRIASHDEQRQETTDGATVEENLADIDSTIEANDEKNND